MPLVRKIIRVGKAKAVTLPAEWLKCLKECYGKEPREVLLEIDDIIKIKPRI